MLFGVKGDGLESRINMGLRDGTNFSAGYNLAFTLEKIKDFSQPAYHKIGIVFSVDQKLK